jgi:hypothetical protein
MTPTAYTQIVPWDRFLSFLRPAFPSSGAIDRGGDIPSIIGVLRQDAVVEEYAMRLFKLDCEHEARTHDLRQKLSAETARHRKAEEALRGDLKRFIDAERGKP